MPSCPIPWTANDFAPPPRRSLADLADQVARTDPHLRALDAALAETLPPPADHEVDCDARGHR